MAIYFNEQSKTFYVESKNLSYVFKVNEHGFLQHLYYGKRVPRENLDFSVALPDRGHGCCLPGSDRCQSMDEYKNECPTFGRSDFRESMIDFTFNSGVVGDLRYDGYEISESKPALSGLPSVRGGQTLIVTLRDEVHGAAVRLYYTAFEDLPVILRHAEITNESAEPIALCRAYSFAVDFPRKNYDAITLPGAHLRERRIEKTRLGHGTFTVQSKRGVSSSQMNPFMAIADYTATETQGEVYGFNLIYSGDFAFRAEVGQCEYLRVTGGLNDYGFDKTLKSGETFVTPEVVAVYSDEGLGKMSRAFHDLYRDYLVNPHRAKSPRPIVINNWEATYFDFDTDKLCAIIDSVEGTGIDTFVLDDGWFGARNHDRAGLGDWVVNENKLRGGLGGVIDHAHAKGLKFGLWFEPEMVNADSDLFRAHPDWIIRADGVEPCPGRDQYVLDLSRAEVRDYVVTAVSKVLRNNAIDYVKWDMNRALSETRCHHDYVLGLYEVFDRIIGAFPNVIFEGCASGGCRFDPAILYWFPQIWTSDNSDAYARTAIQYGTSVCYPLSAMSCHVSVCPNHQTGRNTPFASRAAIAHLGATGYELNPNNLSDKDKAEIKAQVDEYKAMESLVLTGDLYRLNNPVEENLFAEMLVSKDKREAVLTAMRPLSAANGESVILYPGGLDENADYELLPQKITRKGATFIRAGIVAYFPFGDFGTVVYKFRKVEE